MPDGSQLGRYEMPSRLMNEMGNEMDCNCARDEKIFLDKGIQFTMQCSNNGNYDRMQHQNGKIYCVDSFGFAVSPLFDPVEGMLNKYCDQFMYDKQEDIFDSEIDYDEY